MQRRARCQEAGGLVRPGAENVEGIFLIKRRPTEITDLVARRQGGAGGKPLFRVNSPPGAERCDAVVRLAARSPPLDLPAPVLP